MTEQKKKVGRPKKDGATALWEGVKNTEQVKAALEGLEQRMTVAALRGQTPDPVALAQQFQKLELLDFLLDNLDLVQKFSDGNFAKAAQGHPGLAELLDTRLRRDVYVDKRYKTSIDDALKTYMNDVIKSRTLKANREEAIPSAKERRDAAVIASAQKIKKLNGGVLPSYAWIDIQRDLKEQQILGNKGKPISESTITRVLREKKT
jgi:hypothetical protein